MSDLGGRLFGRRGPVRLTHDEDYVEEAPQQEVLDVQPDAEETPQPARTAPEPRRSPWSVPQEPPRETPRERTVDSGVTEAAPSTCYPQAGYQPKLGPNVYVHPSSRLIGNVSIGADCLISPMVCIRADCGGPIRVSDGAFIGDMVSITGFNTHDDSGQQVEKNVVYVGDQPFSVYIGARTHVFPQCGIHGPVILGDDVFVMSQSFLMMAIVESGVVIEPDAKVIGVRVARGRIVPAGAVVKTQEVANSLPRMTEDYPLKSVSEQAAALTQILRKGYLKRDKG